MITHIRFSFASIAVALLAWLALAVPAENLAMAYDGKTVTVTEKDSGGKVSLSKGDTLIVRVEGNAGTGYSWTLVKNDAAVLSLQSQSIERLDKLPGGKFAAVFQFRAVTAGTTNVEINYARPFEKDKKAARTFTLQARVD